MRRHLGVAALAATVLIPTAPAVAGRSMSDSSTRETDLATVAYAADGSPLWTQTFSGGEYAGGEAVGIDSRPEPRLRRGHPCRRR